MSPLGLASGVDLGSQTGTEVDLGSQNGGSCTVAIDGHPTTATLPVQLADPGERGGLRQEHRGTRARIPARPRRSAGLPPAVLADLPGPA